MRIGSMSNRDAYQLILTEYPDVMDIHQMSDLLNISTKTGYKLINEGQIAAFKVGRAFRIPKIHVFEYLKIGLDKS